VNNTQKFSAKDPSVKQPQIVLIIGSIAVGKSTLARKFQREQFAGSILIDVDQFILDHARILEFARC
jgi:pantothenate kinase